MKKTLSLSAVLLALTINPVWASPYSSTMTADGFDSSPDSISTPNKNGSINIKDSINLLLGTSYENNQDVDFMQVTGNDSTWQDLSTANHKAIFAPISISAGNTNSLFVYNINTSGSKVNPFATSFAGGTEFLGQGNFDHPFTFTTMPLANGTNFQWALQTSSHGLTYNLDSNPSNNIEGYDQMLTYHLTALQNKSLYLQSAGSDPELYTFNDPYLITWEDVSLEHNGSGSDQDFNDITFLVDRVAPVAAPEPVSTVLFIVGGLIMAAGLMRRRMRLTA